MTNGSEELSCRQAPRNAMTSNIQFFFYKGATICHLAQNTKTNSAWDQKTLESLDTGISRPNGQVVGNATDCDFLRLSQNIVNVSECLFSDEIYVIRPQSSMKTFVSDKILTIVSFPQFNGKTCLYRKKTQNQAITMMRGKSPRSDVQTQKN